MKAPTGFAKSLWSAAASEARRRLGYFGRLLKSEGGVALRLPPHSINRWAAALEVTNAAAETIPMLRPPRGEIPPGFWEQHGLLVALISVGCLLLAAAAVWWIRRPKALELLSPAEQARRALEPLRSRTEDGLVLSQVSQILRRYFLAAFGMAKAELTTTEFQRAVEANDQVEPALASDLNQFLRNCDQRKFAPGATQPACGAVDRALEFIVRAETRLTALREREQSGSAPVTATKKESAVG